MRYASRYYIATAHQSKVHNVIDDTINTHKHTFKFMYVYKCKHIVIVTKSFIVFQGMSFVAQDRGPRLFPMEPRFPSPWGHCSSSPPPPTRIAQNQLETIAPLAEERWDDESVLAA